MLTINHNTVKKIKLSSLIPGKLFYSFILFAVMMGMVIACNQELADSKNPESQSYSLDQLFEAISSTPVKRGSVLYVEFTWNKIDNTAVIDFIEEREPDFFVLETAKSSGAKITGPSYTVECSNGSKSWTKTCDSKLSYGTLIKECLDQGGCATICQKKMVYLGDEYNTFYVY